MSITELNNLSQMYDRKIVELKRYDRSESSLVLVSNENVVGYLYYHASIKGTDGFGPLCKLEAKFIESISLHNDRGTAE
jgi:hypothetical protein